MNIKKKTWLIYTIPMVVAALVRIIFFFQWFDSPFRYYHILTGLDMRTFYEWSERFYNGSMPFFIYRFFLGIIYGIEGKGNLVETAVILQMVFGVLITGMTVYIFIHIFRNRFGAIVAGICNALYAPYLIYESHLLKETIFIFFCMLALVSVITLRRKKFPPLYSFITGVLLISPFYVRFSGLLLAGMLLFWIFLYCLRKKRSFKPLIFIFLGGLSLMLLIAGYNLIKNQPNTNYFKPNAPYLIGIGAQPDIKNLSYHIKEATPLSTSDIKFSEYINNYIKKPGYIFSGYEQPNNLNYYFQKEKLPLLNKLIGPLFFIPIAVAGMILIFLNSRERGKISILLFYMLAFIIPMMLFVPLARYKIVLAPIFSVFAAFWIYQVYLAIYFKGRNKLVKPLLIFLFTLIFSGWFCRDLPKRKSDIQAYGIAASYIPDKLMREGKFHEAEKILDKYYINNENNPYIMLNYVSSLLGTGQAKVAWLILNQPYNIEEPALVGRYFYEVAECSYILNNFKDALKCYRSAIKYPISEQRLKLAIQRIQLLSKEKKVPEK